MNHPLFFLSIAALGLFYGVFFLSILRGEFRARNGGDSGGDSSPPPPTRRNPPSIVSVFLAHWVGPADYAPPSVKLSKGLPWYPTLSVN